MILLVSLLIASVSAASNWHVIWVGGQSNSVGTNSDAPGSYPTWPANDLIQMYCWNGRGCKGGSFAPATVPVWGESNVGFSLTFANLYLKTLPEDHGIVLLNTGVGGTGFHDGRWLPPNGPLAIQSVNAVKGLFGNISSGLGGTSVFQAMLFHQGEEDAGDNRGMDERKSADGLTSADGRTGAAPFQADYCTYLVNDISALIDFFRENFPGASNSTPFIDGGLLPYWEDAVKGTEDVVSAIYALNTSRVCTATADSRVFPDFLPDGTPNGDPKYRSGASGDVIHFTATQAFFMGFQYWQAYEKALELTQVVPSSRTAGCSGTPQAPVTKCW